MYTSYELWTWVILFLVNPNYDESSKSHDTVLYYNSDMSHNKRRVKVFLAQLQRAVAIIVCWFSLCIQQRHVLSPWSLHTYNHVCRYLGSTSIRRTQTRSLWPTFSEIQVKVYFFHYKYGKWKCLFLTSYFSYNVVCIIRVVHHDLGYYNNDRDPLFKVTCKSFTFTSDQVRPDLVQVRPGLVQVRPDLIQVRHDLGYVHARSQQTDMWHCNTAVITYLYK